MPPESRRHILIVAVDAPPPALRRAVGDLEAIFLEPTRESLRSTLRELRASGSRDDRQIVTALISSHRPDLLGLAVALDATLLAAHHDADAIRSHVRRAASRAAFALVDLTVVPDANAERSAIFAGADPDHIVSGYDDLVERLAVPRRRERKKAVLEAAMSLALDAAEMAGLLRIAELVTPNRGVNVVNYHRILPLAEAATYCRPQMALAEPIFEAQLGLIARTRGFTRIDRIRDESSKGKVAITFDDGYEDNFRVALPILQRFSTPACIFIVTNLIGRPDALWWDRIGLALFAFWKAGDRSAEFPKGLPDGARALWSTSSFDDARAIISSVIGDLNRAPEEDRRQAIALSEALVPPMNPERTMLSWEEVSEMANVGIAFGGHTRNHIPLDELPRETAFEELYGSHIDVDSRISVQQPKVVALPRGRLGPLTEEDLRAQGLHAVMTSFPGVNRTDQDSLFVLRRDGRMLTLGGRHHPAKLRLELTGLLDRLRALRAGSSIDDY